MIAAEKLPWQVFCDTSLLDTKGTPSKSRLTGDAVARRMQQEGVQTFSAPATAFLATS